MKGDCEHGIQYMYDIILVRYRDINQSREEGKICAEVDGGRKNIQV